MPNVIGLGHASFTVMDLDRTLEFLQYLTPKTEIPYHQDPSIAGSGHLAFNVEDLEGMYRHLLQRGVTAHSQINDCVRDGVLVWRWVYVRDPDGICCELVELQQQRKEDEA